MKTALMIWGGWDGHEPRACVDIVAPALEKKGFRVELSDSLDVCLDQERMSEMDLIVPAWTMGEYKDEQVEGICTAVKKGCGIGGWHGGMCDSSHDNSEYQFMTGGQFVAHPNNIYRYEVNIINKEDPITAGFEDFSIESEQYYMHVDPSNEVLATTTFQGDYGEMNQVQGTVMPVVWKRMYGKGRVFYISLGHVAREFKEVPELLEMTIRGLIWAAGS